MSSSGDTLVFLSIFINGKLFLLCFVEVFASTLGHAGAFVSAPKSSTSSSAEVELSFAAAVRLQRVIEKPGPLRELSKRPEYIFVGLMFHFVSVSNQLVLTGSGNGSW